MARIPRARTRRNNRNRIYTIVSLVIVVVIIAYIYLPFGPNRSDQLITNSNNTTVRSDSAAGSETDNTPGADASQAPSQADSSRQDSVVQDSGTSPDWTSSATGQSTSVPEGQATNIPPAATKQTDTSVQPAAGRVTAPTGSVTGQPGVSNSEADKLIAEATSLLSQGTGNILAARDKLNLALRSNTISAQQKKFVKDKLSSLANDWLFNRAALPGDTLCVHYKVQPGDQLRIIGDKNKVPYEFLMDINKINDARLLQAGQTIKLVKGPFNVKVYRSTFTLDVYLQNTYVRSFKVGLGLPGTETPTGLWRVQAGGKLIEPEWTDKNGHTYYPTDPDYPLGSRWIALDGLQGDAKGREGFAIHGTHQPESLGTASSQGCIRLENGNAVMVYNMLIPTYSTVEVLD